MCAMEPHTVSDGHCARRVRFNGLSKLPAIGRVVLNHVATLDPVVRELEGMLDHECGRDRRTRHLSWFMCRLSSTKRNRRPRGSGHRAIEAERRMDVCNCDTFSTVLPTAHASIAVAESNATKSRKSGSRGKTPFAGPSGNLSSMYDLGTSYPLGYTESHASRVPTHGRTHDRLLVFG